MEQIYKELLEEAKRLHKDLTNRFYMYGKRGVVLMLLYVLFIVPLIINMDFSAFTKANTGQQILIGATIGVGIGEMFVAGVYLYPLYKRYLILEVNPFNATETIEDLNLLDYYKSILKVYEETNSNLEYCTGIKRRCLAMAVFSAMTSITFFLIAFISMKIIAM